MKAFFSKVILCAFGALMGTIFFAHASYNGKWAVGQVFMYGGSACPSGTIPLDGSSLLRAGVYANLFGVLSTTYGSADGSHFTLPNANGVFVRGSGSSTQGGVSYTGTRGTFTKDNFASHSHSILTQSTAPASQPPSVSGSAAFQAGTAGTGGGAYIANAPANSDPYIQATGSGTETYPANIVLLYCIAY